MAADKGVALGPTAPSGANLEEVANRVVRPGKHLRLLEPKQGHFSLKQVLAPQ